MKAAIYARVSKERCPARGCGHFKSEHHAGAGRCLHESPQGPCKCTEYQGQDPLVQLDQLRVYAASQQWDAIEFVDYETGKHSDREQLNAMFARASRREFGVLLVWALDRLTREGILETLQHLRTLKTHGVEFHSFSEPLFRTGSGPYAEIFSELLIALAASFAKMERQRISERTKAGLERAEREGKKLGPPPRVYDRDKALAMRTAGKSWRYIGRELGIAHSTIRFVVQQGVQQTSPETPKAPKANKRLR